MVHSNNQDIVLEKMLAERTQLRQAIDLVKRSFRNGVSCNLPKETLDKLAELGYI
nr:MAG TPA: Neuropeptide S precursor protein [Caudoviricetes sp.]